MNKQMNPKGVLPEESISGSENIFNPKEIIAMQNNLRKLYENFKGTDDIEYFSKIKFRDVVYEVGEYIALETLSKHEFYVAKLTKVIRVKVKEREKESNKQKDHEMAFVEVEWALKKNDLPQHLMRLFADYISTAQLFPSNQRMYFYISSLRCKVTMLTIEEYGQLGNASEFIFYTRSSYNSERQSLVPDPSTWAYDCSCRKPNNPDLKYVECSKCNRWFHADCVEPNIINNEFLCSGCFGPSGRTMLDEMEQRW